MRPVSIALAIVLFSVLLSPLRRELYVGDETKYSQVVREMRDGSFFLPTLHGSPFTHKPPLHFWIVATLTIPFGVYSLWPFVLPSLIAFALLLWLLWKWGGPMAAFVAGTSLMVWGSAQTARMDLEYTLLLALAAFFLHCANGALPLSAGIATGVATMIKGPMAPVIIVTLFLFESLRRRRAPKWRDALAVMAMIVIPLLWLVPALILGGESFWREIFFKQTVGRAVSAWVHQSPPWFYLMRAPLTLMPWFFLLIPAVITAWRGNDERAKFGLSWILAVLVPHSILSSKLDVYMIAALPAVALVISRYIECCIGKWGRRANLVMLSLLALIGAAGLIVQPHQIKEADGVLIARVDVRMLFAMILAGAIVAFVVTLRGRLVPSTIATGLVLVMALSYAALALVPLANELASTRPLVRALQEQPVAPEQVACFVCPHLWVRGMNPSLARVQYVDAQSIRARTPAVIVARRKNAHEINLAGYRKVRDLRMIGKWFDVYRR